MHGDSVNEWHESHYKIRYLAAQDLYITYSSTSGTTSHIYITTHRSITQTPGFHILKRKQIKHSDENALHCCWEERFECERVGRVARGAAGVWLVVAQICPRHNPSVQRQRKRPPAAEPREPQQQVEHKQAQRAILLRRRVG